MNNDVFGPFVARNKSESVFVRCHNPA